MFEIFISAFLGAATGVSFAFWLVAKAFKKAIKETGATVGLFEIYED